LALSNLNVDIRNLRFQDDTVFFKIKDINFDEKSGYQVKKVAAENAFVCATQIMLQKLIIDDYQSYLTLNHYAMSFSSTRDFSLFPEKVTMDADFNNAIFDFSSINHYANGFHSDQLKVRVHGKANGTLNRLSGSKISIIKESGNTRILTSFKMSGLPKINETGFSLQLQALSTTANDLSDILHSLLGPKYTASTDKIIRRLGNMQFQGNFDGLYNDFVTYGDVETSIGEATVDMLFHKTGEKSFTAEGDAQVRHFDIGKFIDLPILGEVSSNAAAVLTFNPSDNESFNFKLTGDVSSLDFNRYTYSNININGELSDRRFEGKVKVNDPNLKMDFNGLLAYSQRQDTSLVLRHNYQADIQYANLRALNFNPRDTVSEIKTSIIANVHYNKTIDGGVGKIEAMNVYYRDKDHVHNVGDIALTFAQGNNNYRTQLRSKYADIDYKGALPLSNFINDFCYASHLKYLPLLGDSSKHSVNRTSDYNLTLQVKQGMDELACLLKPGLQIGNQTKVDMTLTPVNILSLHLESPDIALNQYRLKGVKMKAQGNDKQLNIALDMNSAELAGLALDNITTAINVSPNKVNTKIQYKNNSPTMNKGMLHFNTSLAENVPERFPVIHFALLPSELTINDTTWQIAPAQIAIDSATFNFGRISFSNLNQQIALQGTISPEKSDTLSLFFTNFELANINPISRKEGFALKGVLSGRAQVTDVYGRPMFYINVDAQQVKVNDRPLDNITVRSRWDNENQLLRLHTEIKEGPLLRMLTRGVYKPAKDSLHLTTQFTRFSVAHVEPLVQGVFSNVAGCLSGEVRTEGSLKAPLLSGSGLKLDSLGLTVDYLNTHYLLTAPIEITPTLITIQNGTIYDGSNGDGTVNGTFRHQGFRNIKYEVEILANNLLCMNTTIKNNELFYGKAYATGQVRIKGDKSDIHFDITASTEPNTICNIPLSNREKAKESNMLVFKAPETVNEDEKQVRITPKTKLHMTLELNLTPSSNADIQIIFDEKAGDIIKGRGNGNIRLSLDPSIDKFDLFGNYAIEQGNYLFTLQNILSKHFTIEQGSHISFNGDIYKTTLDITAVYKTKANLNALLADTSEAGNIRRNIDCRIHITGNLFTPNLNYNVEVQNVEANLRAQVEAAMNSDEKMMRQFVSLLTLGSFMPDDQSGISSINLSASAAEILSNQLSNILTQLNAPFDIGIVYNTTAAGNNALDIAVSTQLYNNRLIINGAFGNAKTYNSDFSNDIDIELKFDKQGRFRGKAFTHSADQFTNQIDNSQRSGLGFIYQEDFNSFNELFNRWFGWKKSKPEAVRREGEDEEE